MTKKLIVFDLDGTLAPSKSVMPDRIAELLNKLLEHYQVCIISGGKYELFQRQVLTQITKSADLLSNLHLMPTSGTRYYRFDKKSNNWQQLYAENLTKTQKQKIVRALKEGLEESGYKEKKTYGKTIEDRESQITLSILGQEIVAELGEEGVRIKEEWDPDGAKKEKLRKRIAPKIPEFEVRSAGATSIDVTKPGIDKAYGMQKLLDMLSIKKEDVLFIGDRLQEGGNDYPVKAMGIDCVEVPHWQETALVIEAIINVT